MNGKGAIIKCACGCGQKLYEQDCHYRYRKYISGHNGRKYRTPMGHKKAWADKNRTTRTNKRRIQRQVRKGKLVVYKGGVCLDCGALYTGINACIFDFHHRDPKAKLFGISGLLMERSIVALGREADKCDLVYACCHRIRHSDEY